MNLHLRFRVVCYGLFLVHSSLISQPATSIGTNSILPGDVYSYYHADWNYSEPIVGQENVTWDYSGLDTSSGFLSVVFSGPNASSPNGTEIVGQFPSGGSDRRFFKHSEQGVLRIGTETWVPNTTTNCLSEDGTLWVPFATYGTVLNTTAAWDCSNSSSTSSYSINTSITGTSYGTLLLPYGTVENVIMVAFSNVSQGAPGFVHSWLFMSPNVRLPILWVQASNGIPTYAQLTVRETVLSVRSSMERPMFRISPNPTSGLCLLTMPSGKPISAITIVDAFGRSIDQIALAGSGIFEMDFGDYSGGIYFLQTLFMDGSSAIARVIKE